MRIKHVLAKKCRFDMQFQCIEAIFTPNDDVFVFIMPLHGCSFLPHQIVVDILVVSKPKPDVRKAKKDSSNANKKDVRTITQSEEQEKLLSDLLGGIRDRKFNIELQFLVDENKKSNTKICSSMLNLRCRMSLALLLHRKMYCQSYF